jgi:hypothetical protein
MVLGSRAELVVAEIGLAADETEGARSHDRAPEALLRADRAVAATRADGEIDVGLKADSAAMAASLISFHHSLLSLKLFPAPLAQFRSI